MVVVPATTAEPRSDEPALAELQATIAEQAKVIESLREQVAHMRKQLFGRSREKIDPAQLRMFQQSAALLESLEAATASAKAAAKPAKKGHGGPAFAADLPRDTVKLDMPEEARCCKVCDERLKLIGVTVTERGHMIPARMVVKRYERGKYACPNGHGVTTAPLPDGVVDKGKYEASVYAFIATAKYADHLPLHRLQGILKRNGAHLPKQSMWDLMVRLDELVAQPVLKEMHRQLLEERVLQADETTIKVQEEGVKGTRRGVLWAWRNLRGSPVEKVLVEFKPDRSSRGPDAFLGDWSGTLLTDGYDGVNPIAERNDIQRAGCWSHARRKFVDALNASQERSAAALIPIERLFWIERAVAKRAKHVGLDREGHIALRQQVRDRLSRQLLKDLYEVVYALDEDPSVVQGSKLYAAVRYAINQRRPLTALLRHPEIPIHNNDTERDLRHVVTGRKNWLIFGSQRGGEVAGRLYSLVISCKLAGIDPMAYLEDALSLISTVTDVSHLTPWGWNCLRESMAVATAE